MDRRLWWIPRARTSVWPSARLLSWTAKLVMRLRADPIAFGSAVVPRSDQASPDLIARLDTTDLETTMTQNLFPPATWSASSRAPHLSGISRLAPRDERGMELRTSH